MPMRYIVILFFFTSCAIFNSPRLSPNVFNASEKVCLNADGNGRLNVQGHKYVFGHETLMDQEENKWIMSLNFPIYGQELIELDLSKDSSELKQKIEERILSEKRGVDPVRLNLFITHLGSFLKELVALKNKKQIKNKFTWKVNKNELTATLKSDKNLIYAKFYNLNEKYFGKMDFSYDAIGNPQDNLKIELIVRQCLD